MKKIILISLMVLPAVALGQDAAQVTAKTGDYLSMAEKIFALFGIGGALAMFVPPKIRAAIPVVNMVLRVIRFEFLGQKQGAPDQDRAPDFIGK